MQIPEVKVIDLETPVKSIGKIYTGDYSKSPQYIMEIQAAMKEKNIPFIENKVMGVYYDNPADKKPGELKSFQGVFLKEDIKYSGSSLTEIIISGKCVYTKVSGDPVRSLYEGYNAVFGFIQKNKIELKSSEGYQVSTFENGVITTEIYMRIKQ